MNSHLIQHNNKNNNNNNNKPTTTEDNGVHQVLAGGARINMNSYSYNESQRDALFLKFIR
jgi:hypothetical protein